MRIATDRVNTLVTNGLSDHEARVYLALLDHPDLAASSLAKVSTVPRNRLYEALESLHGHGLVDILVEAEARRYRARPILEYLDGRIRDHNARVAQMRDRRDSLSAMFRPPSPQPIDPDSGVTRVLIGRATVAREIDRLIDSAQRSVIVISSKGGYERVLCHLSDIPPGRGLSLTTYLPYEAATAPRFERFRNTFTGEIRWFDHPLEALRVVVDDLTMLTVHAIPDNGAVRTGRDFGLLTTNGAMVRDILCLVGAASAQGEASEALDSVPSLD